MEEGKMSDGIADFLFGWLETELNHEKFQASRKLAEDNFKLQVVTAVVNDLSLHWRRVVTAKTELLAKISVTNMQGQTREVEVALLLGGADRVALTVRGFGFVAREDFIDFQNPSEYGDRLKYRYQQLTGYF